MVNVTGYTNLESLKCYLEWPSKEDKDKVVTSDAFFRYAHNVEVDKEKTDEPNEANKEMNDEPDDVIYS